jgi:hypothetical protein
VETITPLDHDFRVTSLHNSACKDVHSWKIIVDRLEIIELGGIDDLLIYLGKIDGSLRRYLSDRLVTVEPTPAWTNFQAV